MNNVICKKGCMFLKVLSTLVVITSISTGIAHAQTGGIYGVVTEQGTGDELIGANVLLEGTSMGASTDADGRFRIRSVPEGSYTLRVTYIGFQTYWMDVDVTAGENLELEIQLIGAGLEGEEIVFSVQARGQRSAINQQLSSNRITNIVSSDRIREMPDVNAAESVGRLPGVSILRSSGEANRIAIRGLSPQYNTITVNGVRVPATDASSRAVDLSLISSDMLDGIEVTKAITPDQDGDAIGGSVDLKLREAGSERILGFDMQGGYNQVQDYYGNYKVSATASDRFFNDRLGIIVGLNTDHYDRSADKFSGNYGTYHPGGDADRILINNGLSLEEDFNRRQRVGGNLSVDYRIPNGRILVNSYYNELSWDRLVRNTNYNVGSRELNYQVRDETGSHNIMSSSIGINQDYDRFSVDAGLAYSATYRDSPNNYTYNFQEQAAFVADISIEEMERELSMNNIPDYARYDMETTRFDDLQRGLWNNEESEWTAQANIEVPFRLTRWLDGHVKTGAKYRRMDREREGFSNSTGLRYGGDLLQRNIIAERMPELGYEPGPGLDYFYLDAFLDESFNREGFLDGEYDFTHAGDPDILRQVMEIAEEHSYPHVPWEESWLDRGVESRRNNYHGREEITAGYIMTEMNLGNMVTFIPGVRVEHETSDYTGIYMHDRGVYSNLIDTTSVREFTHVLPMHHLQIRPTEWLGVRLAYTRSLTRPNYRNYAPSTYIHRYYGYAETSNPDLKPATSTNYDLSVSVHNNHIGLFTVSGFYKSIDDLVWGTSFVLSRNQPPEIFSHVDIPEIENMAIPVNTHINSPHETTFKGVEFDWQTHFWYLPGLLQGLVFNANMSFIESATRYPFFESRRGDIIPGTFPPEYEMVVIDSSRAGRMQHQPSFIANLTIGYDYRDFSIRVSYLYQDDVAASIHSSQPLNDHFTGKYYRWDVTAQQKLPWGLELFGNFNNINNRPDRNFRAEVGEHPSYIEYYGFTMDLGLRARF